MIIFGWGNGAKRLGDGFLQTCENCHNTQQFVVAEMSRRASLYFITVAKWSKRYYYVCPVCAYGFEIPTRELAQRILAAAFRDPTTVPDRLAKKLAEAVGQGKHCTE
jgi:transcription elongation factor Elf1